MNGRDLSEFAATVVTRGGDQLIVGRKVFSGTVQTAGLVVVGGLNGLKVPEDVVMVDQDAIQAGRCRMVSSVCLRLLLWF